MPRKPRAKGKAKAVDEEHEDVPEQVAPAKKQSKGKEKAVTVEAEADEGEPMHMDVQEDEPMSVSKKKNLSIDGQRTSLRQDPHESIDKPVAAAGGNTGEDVEDDFFGQDPDTLLKIKAESFIGCLTMNILEPPQGTLWGYFNNRAMVPSHVAKLHQKFKIRLDNCVDENVMHIAVKRKWVKNISQAEEIQRVDGRSIDTVPEMELTADGVKEIKKEKLFVMGGNHRRLALQKFVDELQVLLKDAQANAGHPNATTVSKPKKGQSKGQPENKDEAEKLVAELTTRISNSSKWAVYLYDLGAQIIFDVPTVGTDDVRVRRESIRLWVGAARRDIPAFVTESVIDQPTGDG